MYFASIWSNYVAEEKIQQIMGKVNENQKLAIF